MISLCYYYYFLEKFCHMSNFDSLGDCDLVYKTYKGIVNPLSNEKKMTFFRIISYFNIKLIYDDQFTS